MSTIISTTVTPPTMPAIGIKIESLCSKPGMQASTMIDCPDKTGKNGTTVDELYPTLTVELLPKSETQDQGNPLYTSKPVIEKPLETSTAAPLPKPIAESPPQEAVVKSTKVTVDPLEDEKKPSAWERFREGLAHDPLNDPEFVEAYNDWKKRNRKERYERRRAWIRAHGSRLGRLVRLVDKKKSDEDWAAYQEKLAYMED
jgi:hypothetical protein